MKNFQKMLLVFISIALLTGCQDNSQQGIRSQIIKTEIKKITNMGNKGIMNQIFS